MKALRGRVWPLALGLLLGVPVTVWAEPPASSLRPVPRPGPVFVQPPAEALAPAPQAVAGVVLRPRPRPVTDPGTGIAAAPALVSAPALISAQPDASIRRLSVTRPQPRPPGWVRPLSEQAAPAAPATVALAKPARRKKADKTARQGGAPMGSVCGDAAIAGAEIARLTSAVTGCGIAAPVRVTAVSGVALNPPATLDCSAAQALRRWVDTGLQPSFGRKKVVELRVAAHYVCRARNNVKGAKVSEHGRGKAIDIAAVVLADGTTMSVQDGFGRELRRAHKAACGTFGTTLGPGSDGFHEDHLHFDTATHRGGPYCR